MAQGVKGMNGRATEAHHVKPHRIHHIIYHTHRIIPNDVDFVFTSSAC